MSMPSLVDPICSYGYVGRAQFLSVINKVDMDTLGHVFWGLCAVILLGKT